MPNTNDDNITVDDTGFPDTDKPAGKTVYGFLENLWDATVGNTPEEKAASLRAIDEASMLEQSNITGCRVIRGARMLVEYGNPPQGEMQKKRREVGEKYGLQLRHAYNYMAAAEALELVCATGLHISDTGDNAAKLLNIPNVVLDRPIEQIPRYVQFYLAGLDADKRDDESVDAQTITMGGQGGKKDKPKPDPKPKSLKQWDEAAAKLLRSLPVEKVKDSKHPVTKAADALMGLRQQIDRKLMDVERKGHPSKDILVAELESLVDRASALTDYEESWKAISGIASHAHDRMVEARKLYEAKEDERKIAENRKSIEASLASPNKKGVCWVLLRNCSLLPHHTTLSGHGQGGPINAALLRAYGFNELADEWQIAHDTPPVAPDATTPAPVEAEPPQGPLDTDVLVANATPDELVVAQTAIQNRLVELGAPADDEYLDENLPNFDELVNGVSP